MTSPSSWNKTSLGRLLRIKHGFAFKGEYFADKGTFVLLTPGNFKADGGLKLKGEKEKYYTGPVSDEFVLTEGDLLIAMTDLTQNAPILGSAAIIPESGKFLHNQRLGKIVDINTREITREYLYYLFNSPDVRAQIKASATGATVRHTAPERIYAVSVSVPSIVEQQQIAACLSAYDDLIENCQRRIRVLDEMARALYREWFVEFRYPGHDQTKMVRSAMGRIPVGWRVERAATLLVEERRAVPKGKVEGIVRYVGLEHIPRRSLALDAWDETSELGSNKLSFEHGDVLFGKIRPYFHKVIVAPFAGVCSADTFVIQPAEPSLRAFVTCLVASDGFVAHASATANGSKMPRASWGVMTDFRVAVPPPELLDRFSSFVLPWIEEQQCLVARIHNLRRARELLLPRLLSGQLQVAGSESVEDAA